jgi:hypothetical protein
MHCADLSGSMTLCVQAADFLVDDEAVSELKLLIQDRLFCTREEEDDESSDEEGMEMEVDYSDEEDNDVRARAQHVHSTGAPSMHHRDAPVNRVLPPCRPCFRFPATFWKTLSYPLIPRCP